jgi:predicted PurR-regulated permease PerM
MVLSAYILFVLIAVAILLLYRRTANTPSNKMVDEIHVLINDIVEQANILDSNIQLLQQNVDMLNDEVTKMKLRNAELAEQLQDISQTIKSNF